MKIKPVFVRGFNNYDADEVSRETASVFDGETMTQQSFAQECDINVIVERFGITGVMPQSVVLPSFADFEGVPQDYHTAVLALTQANEAFLTLPAEVRASFNNDAGAFVAFASDANNLQKMRDWGLASVTVGDKVLTPSGDGATHGDKDGQK